MKLQLKQLAINLIYGTAVIWAVIGIIYGTKELFSHIVAEPDKTIMYLFLYTAFNAGLVCLGGMVFTLVKMIEDEA